MWMRPRNCIMAIYRARVPLCGFTKLLLLDKKDETTAQLESDLVAQVASLRDLEEILFARSRSTLASLESSSVIDRAPLGSYFSPRKRHVNDKRREQQERERERGTPCLYSGRGAWRNVRAIKILLRARARILALARVISRLYFTRVLIIRATLNRLSLSLSLCRATREFYASTKGPQYTGASLAGPAR